MTSVYLSNIKHTIYITFVVNPFTKLDLIIGRKYLNQHNLFVLTQTRMGFDPTLVETSHCPDDIGLLPLGAESDIGTDVVVPGSPDPGPSDGTYVLVDVW